MQQTVKAKDVKVGDWLILESGASARVEKISNGMPRNSVLFDFRGGAWACCLAQKTVFLGEKNVNVQQ